MYSGTLQREILYYYFIHLFHLFDQLPLLNSKLYKVVKTGLDPLLRQIAAYVLKRDCVPAADHQSPWPQVANTGKGSMLKCSTTVVQVEKSHESRQTDSVMQLHNNVYIFAAIGRRDHSKVVKPVVPSLSA